MLQDGLARILVVDSDATERGTIVSALRKDGFRVWETDDTTDAVSIVHQSPHPLVVVVGAACSRVLRLAETDRRLVHHHAYILLQPEAATAHGECAWSPPYLKLWTLPSPPDRQALLTAVVQAQRALDIIAIG